MLSIITISRNDIYGLKRTVESTRQIRSEWESIEQLVIDGSDDELAADNLKLCKDHVKVNYFRREPRGISDAFNFGISIAKYKWLWFLNGGDQLNRTLDLFFFYSFLRNVTADILIFHLELMQKGEIVQFPSLNRSFPPVSPWIPHPATIVNKEVFLKYGPFNEKYEIAMDYEFWLRIYPEKVIVNMVSIPIASYDEKGLSSTQIAKVSDEGRKILKKNKMKLFKLWLNTGKNILKQYRKFNRSVNGN